MTGKPKRPTRQRKSKWIFTSYAELNNGKAWLDGESESSSDEDESGPSEDDSEVVSNLSDKENLDESYREDEDSGKLKEPPKKKRRYNNPKEKSPSTTTISSTETSNPSTPNHSLDRIVKKLMKHPPKTKIKCKKSCTEEQNEADQQILFIEKNKKKIPLLLPKHCGSMHHHNCSARKTTARKQTLNSIKTLHRERIKRPPPSMKISINVANNPPLPRKKTNKTPKIEHDEPKIKRKKKTYSKNKNNKKINQIEKERQNILNKKCGNFYVHDATDEDVNDSIDEVFKIVSEKPPSLKHCYHINTVEIVDRKTKRKPSWYDISLNKKPTVKIIFKHGVWESWSLVVTPIRGNCFDDTVVLKTRGASEYLHVVNSEFTELTLTLRIKSTPGHNLAGSSKLTDKSDSTHASSVPFMAIQNRTPSEDQSNNFVSCVVNLPPRCECRLIQIPSKTEGKPFKYEFEEFWGDPEKKLSPYLWPIPVSTPKPILCSQGFNGKYSHRGSFRYSIDLAIDEGTDVVCPRDGIVLDYCAHYYKTSTCKSFEGQANYITLLHEDGCVSEYVHLEFEGVFVEVGDFVQKGQIIGKSGNTGWSYGPHLHFHVRSDPNKNSATVDIRFDNDTEVGIFLKPGFFYHCEGIQYYTTEEPKQKKTRKRKK